MRLNLNSLLVFFVNAANQVESLLLTFQGLLLSAQLLLLLLLAADHVLHSLRLELVRLFLHFNHFLVLHALLLQPVSLSSVAVSLVILIELNRSTLIFTVTSELFSPHAVLFGPLCRQVLLISACFLITLAHFHNIDGLFLGVLDFFPCFFLFKFEQGDSICKELDVILGSLLRGALASQGVADLHALTVNHLISILLIVAHLLVVLLLVHVILVHLLVV